MRLSITVLIIVAFFMLMAGVFLVRFIARPSAGRVSWQYSMTPEVQLAVRDKYGALGSYTVRFVVTREGGANVQLSRNGNGDGWTAVYFPTDFQTYGQPGRYRWHAAVNGKTVATGTFSMTRDGVRVAE